MAYYILCGVKVWINHKGTASTCVRQVAFGEQPFRCGTTFGPDAIMMGRLVDVIRVCPVKVEAPSSHQEACWQDAARSSGCCASGPPDATPKSAPCRCLHPNRADARSVLHGHPSHAAPASRNEICCDRLARTAHPAWPKRPPLHETDRLRKRCARVQGQHVVNAALLPR